MDNNSEPLLMLTDIHYGYVQRPPLLTGVNLKVYRDERILIEGDNGAGKTTLLHLMVGLKRAQQGQVTAFSTLCETAQHWQRVRTKVGLLFQDPDDQLFCPTVLEDVMFGPLNLGFSKQQAQQKSLDTLAKLGLQGFEQRITHQLSGGEKRMVTLACVLVMEPEVLILDEPTNALDEKAKSRLLHVLQQLPQAMIIISHDKPFAAQLATRVMTLKQGTLHAATTPNLQQVAVA